jgi:hypothetical protein
MANITIPELNNLAELANGDLFEVVDVSDTTHSAEGTSKKVSAEVIEEKILATLNSDNILYTDTAQTLTGLKTLPAGGVIYPTPPVCIMRIGSSGSTSIANGTWTTVDMGQAITNPLGTDMWNASLNPSRITVPYTGVYAVDWAVGFQANATGNRGGRIRANGSVQNFGYHIGSNAGASLDGRVTGGGKIAISAGGYLELDVLQTSGGALNLSHTATWLQVALLSRTA